MQPRPVAADPFEEMFGAIVEAASEAVFRRIETLAESPPPGWFGTKAAADHLDVSVDSLNAMVTRGEVPVHHLGNGRRKFVPAELDALIT